MADGSCWAAPVPRQMNSAAAQDARRVKVAMYIDSLPHLLHNGDKVIKQERDGSGRVGRTVVSV